MSGEPTRATASEPEVFIEYGLSYRGEPPRRFSWTPQYDEAMRDCANRMTIHGEELGPIRVVERTTTITCSEWRPAVRPESEAAEEIL